MTLFPLGRDTVLTVSLGNKVKSIHCLEVCSSWNLAMNSCMLFQYINHSAFSNMLICLTASFCEMTQICPFEDNSFAEALIQVPDPLF